MGGTRVALYRLDDGIFATSDTCPHAGTALSSGCVVEGYIECPLHHALFDIRSGASDGSITPRSLTIFPVKVEGEIIYVGLPEVEGSTR
jgi:nitrite reductase/ring-hydroxylating ferredoxin subunit